MGYIVTGTGAEGQRLVYEKETLPEAAYLASKMVDNGVADARIADANGSEISLHEAWEAFRRDPMPGWTVY